MFVQEGQLGLSKHAAYLGIWGEPRLDKLLLLLRGGCLPIGILVMNYGQNWYPLIDKLVVYESRLDITLLLQTFGFV